MRSTNFEPDSLTSLKINRKKALKDLPSRRHKIVKVCEKIQVNRYEFHVCGKLKELMLLSSYGNRTIY